ncbi:MAG: terminase family protein [Actinomycetota bacterium]|nr:terminase family protein [Actinomycetota bacterium]
MSISELRRALDPVAFAAHAGLSDPDPWQRDLLRSDAPRVLLNCSRQAGKSTTAALLALHKARYTPGSLVLLLAPTLRQSQEFFAKVATALNRVEGGRARLRRGGFADRDAVRRLGLELANSSRIEALPGSEKTVRGFSGVDLLILDEASRIDDGLYHAVRPMLAVSGGRLMVLSTPWGKRGVFFEEWANGEGWERYEVPATKVPRISSEFLEEERRALGERWFRQEYLCSFEETDDSMFASDAIEKALDPTIAPLFGSS